MSYQFPKPAQFRISDQMLAQMGRVVNRVNAGDRASEAEALILLDGMAPAIAELAEWRRVGAQMVADQLGGRVLPFPRAAE